MTTTAQPRQFQSATLMALIIVLLSLSLPLSASATTGDTAASSIKATSRATSLALVDYCTWSVESPHVTYNQSGTKIVNEKSRITCNTSRIYNVKMRMQMQVYGPDGLWHTYSYPDVTHEFKPYPGTQYTRYASRTCNIYGLTLRNRTTFTVSHQVYGTFSKVVYSQGNYVHC